MPFTVFTLLMRKAAAGFGPLSLAVVAGDEGRVQELLSRYPNTLEERNQFGHTPLHIAIHHPPCLRLIAMASAPFMLNAEDAFKRSPLEHACGKNCTESAQILLAAGCSIRMPCIGLVDAPFLD